MTSKLKISLGLLVVLLSVAISAHAESTRKGCLDKAEVQAITKQIQINIGGEQNLCDPNNRYYQLVEALIFMRNIRWKEGVSVPAPFSQNLLGEHWFNDFAQRIKRINWGHVGRWAAKCNSESSSAYAAHGSNELFVCQKLFQVDEDSNLFEDSYHVVDVVSSLLHEMWHTKSKVPHEACVSGGCDMTVEMRGAYAVSLEAYSKMGKLAANLHPAQSSWARHLAYITATTSFVTPLHVDVNSDREVPVFRTRDNQFLSKTVQRGVYAFWEGLKPGHWIRWIGPGSPVYLNIPFDGSDPEIVNSYFYAPKTDFEKFRSETYRPGVWGGFLSSPTIRRLVQDRSFRVQASLVEGGSLFGSKTVGWIIDGKIVMEFGNLDLRNKAFVYQETREVTLPNGETPVALRNGSVAGNDEANDIFVLSDKDRLYHVEAERDFKASPSKFLGYKVTAVPNPYPGYIDAYKTQEKTYLIDKEGRALEIRYGHTPRPIKGLENYRFSSIEFQFYNETEGPAELMPAPPTSPPPGKIKRYEPNPDYKRQRFVYRLPSDDSQKLEIVFRGFFILTQNGDAAEGWVEVDYYNDIGSEAPVATGWIKSQMLGTPILD